MIDPLTSFKAMALGAASTAGVVIAGVEVGISVASIITLATGVGMVVGAISWLDAKIDKKLTIHTEEDNLRHDLILEDNRKGRHEMRAEIRHLREMLSFAGVIPDHTPEAIRVLPSLDDEDDTKP